MRYASIGGGLDPDLAPITPRLGRMGAKPQVWRQAAQAAHSFWRAVEHNQVGLPVSPAFRKLARRNLAVVQAFVAPLLPG